MKTGAAAGKGKQKTPKGSQAVPLEDRSRKSTVAPKKSKDDLKGDGINQGDEGKVRGQGTGAKGC